jgi:hypothetical protein
LKGALLNPSLQGLLDRSIEGPKSEVVADPPLLFQVGGFAAGRLEEQDGREVELTTEMVGDGGGYGERWECV